ncbi:hypothetical protein DFQ27_003166 [Actinomortierella ambigua]|uniref:RING-type domain-containing protein n=1 Tax=Actinomortierella ambigua TaxID=1343610 RepID=A0A9P6Q5J7_9FUNG|nr:hypothetical protein DFQ27_003166 [Actinomortierella ambigua]
MASDELYGKNVLIEKERTLRNKSDHSSGSGSRDGTGSSRWSSVGGGGVDRNSSSSSGGNNNNSRRLIDELDAEQGGSHHGQATCFICDERLFGSLEDINAHIDRCLLHPPSSTSSHHHNIAQNSSGSSSGNNTHTTHNTSSPQGHPPALSPDQQEQHQQPPLPLSSSPQQQQQQQQQRPRVHEPFEEYEWAGQTRIRATALFEGGLANLPGGSTSRLNSAAQTDVDDELNIEDDDEEEYGSAQFSERDVLLQNADAESEELREIVMGSSSSASASSASTSRAPSVLGREKDGEGIEDGDMEDNDNHLAGKRVVDSDDGDEDDDMAGEASREQAGSSRQAMMSKQKRKRKEFEIDIDGDGDGALPDEEQGGEDEDEEEIDIEDDDDDDDNTSDSDNIDAQLSSAFASGDAKLVIEALKGKVRHLEAVNKDVPMCLICLEPYKVPLTSIVCWHVHCEACWFRTLGTKKLCPQCQKITLPKDLRRIYL